MSDVPPMHAVPTSVEAAVRHEFGCYYLADELPAVMDDSWLEAMTRPSAERMSARVGAANLDTLIAHWLDDDCWPKLQQLLGRLATSIDELRCG